MNGKMMMSLISALILVAALDESIAAPTGSAGSYDYDDECIDEGGDEKIDIAINMPVELHQVFGEEGLHKNEFKKNEGYGNVKHVEVDVPHAVKHHKVLKGIHKDDHHALQDDVDLHHGKRVDLHRRKHVDLHHRTHIDSHHRNHADLHDKHHDSHHGKNYP